MLNQNAESVSVLYGLSRKSLELVYGAWFQKCCFE